VLAASAGALREGTLVRSAAGAAPTQNGGR